MPEEYELDSQLEEQSLVERLREKPREAFEEMVRLYQADVRVLTRRHFGNSSAADEVAQQVFVSIYQSLSSYRADGSLRGWVLSITINQIRTYIRAEVRRRGQAIHTLAPELLESSALTHDADPFVLDSARADLTALRDCLTRLDERHRSLVEAFYFQNQSADAIATELGQSAGAVRMLLMRIRQRLAKCIRKKITWQGESP